MTVCVAACDDLLQPEINDTTRLAPAKNAPPKMRDDWPKANELILIVYFDSLN